MKIVLQIAIAVYTSALYAEAAGNTEVVASLYDTVTLHCTFPFIQGPEDLSVAWEKKDEKNGGGRLMVHKYMKGRDSLEDQDRHYTGRTKLSKDFSQGMVELTLREVTSRDEGTYYCQAANSRGHGEQKVKITIKKLNADNPKVTATRIDGKRRMKCITIGVFRNPWVRWFDMNCKDLPEHGTRTITDHSDGKKMVESILDLDVEINEHYCCQVREGRLSKNGRGVIPDGEPVFIPQSICPECQRAPYLYQKNGW